MVGVFGSVLVVGSDEGVEAGETEAAKDEADRGADVSEALASFFAGGDAPLSAKEPDAVGEVPADGDHGDGVDGEHPGILQLHLYFVEGGAGVFRQVDAHEALVQNVLNDVDESDVAGDALGIVHPVPCPGVVDDVALAAQGDIDAIEGVEGQRNKDATPLKDAHQRQAIEEPDLGGIGDGAFERFEVRQDVLDEEGADGYDSGQTMKLAQQEGVSLASAERFYAFGQRMLAAGRMSGGGHELELLETDKATRRVGGPEMSNL